MVAVAKDCCSNCLNEREHKRTIALARLSPRTQWCVGGAERAHCWIRCGSRKHSQWSNATRGRLPAPSIECTFCSDPIQWIIRNAAPSPFLRCLPLPLSFPLFLLIPSSCLPKLHCCLCSQVLALFFSLFSALLFACVWPFSLIFSFFLRYFCLPFFVSFFLSYSILSSSSFHFILSFHLLSLFSCKKFLSKKEICNPPSKTKFLGAQAPSRHSFLPSFLLHSLLFHCYCCLLPFLLPSIHLFSSNKQTLHNQNSRGPRSAFLPCIGQTHLLSYSFYVCPSHNLICAWDVLIRCIKVSSVCLTVCLSIAFAFALNCIELQPVKWLSFL